LKNKHDDLLVICTIIKKLAQETELPIAVILRLVAKEFSIPYKKLKKELKEIINNDMFNKNKSNEIVGYINNEPVKRTTMIMQSNSIISAVLKKVENKFNKKLDKNERKLVIKQIIKRYSLGGNV
jgi:hypothetical protein